MNNNRNSIHGFCEYYTAKEYFGLSIITVSTNGVK
jgi:hypothetical protein